MANELRGQIHQIEFESEACRGCHLCQLACSLYKTGVFSLSNSRVTIRRDAGGFERYRIGLLDSCDGCGQCTTFCGFGALWMASERTS